VCTAATASAACSTSTTDNKLHDRVSAPYAHSEHMSAASSRGIVIRNSSRWVSRLSASRIEARSVRPLVVFNVACCSLTRSRSPRTSEQE